MKIIITEEQLNVLTFQNAIDMAIDDIREKCDEMERLGTEEIISFDSCEQLEVINKVEVVTAYKTENIIELCIIIYIDTIFSGADVGDFFWEIDYHLRTYLGKGNFKLKLLNVINERPKGEW